MATITSYTVSASPGAAPESTSSSFFVSSHSRAGYRVLEHAEEGAHSA